MKVEDILQTELDEKFSMKGAVAAGMLGTAALNPMHGQQERPPVVQPQKKVVQPELAEIHPTAKRIDPKQVAQVARITNKYDVDEELAQQVVELANTYQKPTFPRAKDILAIVGIESSFDPDAQSQLKHDPAMGLTQIRPGVWNIDPAELQGVEAQIRICADILSYYYKKLHNKEAAVQAYNVGLTDYNRGVSAPQYLSKYHREYQLYAGI